MAKIVKLLARQILDSRGFPTVQADAVLSDGTSASASVPSGASTGSFEAFELRDGDTSEYNGKSVHQAVANITSILFPALSGIDASEQEKIDRVMLELDGTENKSRLGANAILAVSIAVARAAADSQKIALFEYLHSLSASPSRVLTMPYGMFNVLNGGAHAANSSDFQEYMIIPMQAQSFARRLQCAAETFQALKKLLQSKKLPTTVGDEGGFAPSVKNNVHGFDLLIEAIANAGYEPGKDVFLAADIAASEFYKNGSYHLSKEKKSFKAKEFITYFDKLTHSYPLVSLEDPLEENDFSGFAELTATLSRHVQIVGDDLYTTNPKRLQAGIEKKSTTAILIKMNQIGTLTETLQTIALAKQAGLKTIVSHRSGETEDSFIADLAVGTNADQVKFGSLTRSERLAKYNRLLKIEEQLSK